MVIERRKSLSWEINTCEWHKIRNVNDETRQEVERLVGYIQQFNKIMNMESMTLHTLRFSVDGKEVLIKDLSEWEPGTTWVTKGGTFVGIKQAEHTQWIETDDFVKMLESAVDAEIIELEMVYSAIVLHGEAVYGCSYWCTDKPIPEGLLGNVERKMLEYYDQDDSVWLYALDENGVGEPTYTEGFLNYSDITSWFSYNFGLELNAEDSWEEDPEIMEALMNMANEFAEKYDMCDEPDEPYEEAFEMSGSLKLSSEKMIEMKKDLQKFADFAKNTDSEMILTAIFTSDEGYPFAAVEYSLEDDDIIVKSCRY